MVVVVVVVVVNLIGSLENGPVLAERGLLTANVERVYDLLVANT